jgi:hypothetical protein
MMLEEVLPYIIVKDNSDVEGAFVLLESFHLMQLEVFKISFKILGVKVLENKEILTRKLFESFYGVKSAKINNHLIKDGFILIGVALVEE